MKRFTKCPVSEIVGDDHYFAIGNGRVIDWDIMGDPRTQVEVCAECAEEVTE